MYNYFHKTRNLNDATSENNHYKIHCKFGYVSILKLIHNDLDPLRRKNLRKTLNVS